jgi:hypothetical protein
MQLDKTNESISRDVGLVTSLGLDQDMQEHIQKLKLND